MRNYLFIFYFWVQKRVNAENKIGNYKTMKTVYWALKISFHFFFLFPKSFGTTGFSLHAFHRTPKWARSAFHSTVDADLWVVINRIIWQLYLTRTRNVFPNVNILYQLQIFIVPFSCIVSQNWFAHVVSFPIILFLPFWCTDFTTVFEWRSLGLWHPTWNCKPTFFAVWALGGNGTLWECDDWEVWRFISNIGFIKSR